MSPVLEIEPNDRIDHVPSITPWDTPGPARWVMSGGYKQ
jgi:hypothetical protein